MTKKLLLITVLLAFFGFLFTNLTLAKEELGCAGNTGVNTAIGCIPVNNVNEFVGFILGWAVGIGGGIAFLLILSASFMIITSSGNPDRLKAGQELLTSAIMGLIMIIFSIFVLRVIGVDILRIPGFS